MGTSVKAQEKPDNEYIRAVNNISNILVKRTFSSWRHFDFLFKFTSDFKKAKENLQIIHNFTKSIIEKRRKELLTSKDNINANLKKNENDDDIGVKKKQAFLDLLLNSTIDGKPLTDADISEEVNTFMFEGHDTTASAIAFCLFELARNPKIQNKVYEEIKELLSNDKYQQPTLNELNNLKYLELVIKETLRLYPSVPYFGRELQEDVTYKGTTYKKGITLVFFVYYMHRRSDLFKDADKFNPDRFLEQDTEMKNSFAYIPFSAGPRNCIGQKFAMYEMKAVLSKILLNFELLPVDKKYDVILSSEIILKSANGVSLKLKNRN